MVRHALRAMVALALVASLSGCGVATAIAAVVYSTSQGHPSSFAPRPAPTVSAVTPATGSHAGGNTITITGANFTADATVTVGGNAATNVVVQSSTSIVATVPRSAKTGAADVNVTSDGGSGSLAGGYVYTNALPTVTVSNVASPQAGNIVITFTLADPEGDLADVAIAVDTGSGFQPLLSSAILSGGLVGLTTSPTGVVHTLTWASGSTYPAQDFSAVRIQLTPTDETDGKQGTAGVSNSFAISNNAPVELQLQQPTKSSFDILLSYTVSDLDGGEGVQVTQLSYTDLLAGKTGNLTIKAGQGVGTCPYSSGGTTVTSLWDTLADLGYGNNKLVQVTVAVSDGKSSAVRTTQPFFVSNGPLSEQSVYNNTLQLSGYAIGDVTGDGKPDIVGVSPQFTFPGAFTQFVNVGQKFVQLTAVDPPFIPYLPVPAKATYANPTSIPFPFNLFAYAYMHPTEAAILDVNGDGKPDFVAADDDGGPFSFDNFLTDFATQLKNAAAEKSAANSQNYSAVMLHQNVLVALQKQISQTNTGIDIPNGTYVSFQATQAQIAPIIRIGSSGPAAAPNMLPPGAALYGQNKVSQFPQALTSDNSLDYLGWFSQQTVAADLDPAGSPGQGTADLVVLNAVRQLGSAFPPAPAPAPNGTSDYTGCVTFAQVDPRSKALFNSYATAPVTSNVFYIDPTDMGKVPTCCAVGDIDSASHVGAPFSFPATVGSPDIIVCNTADDSLTFYLQYQNASWGAAGTTPVPPEFVSFNVPMGYVFGLLGLPAPAAGDTNGVAIGDLNGDGANDFIVTGQISQTAIVFIYDPDPTKPMSLASYTNGLLPFRVGGVIQLPGAGAGRPAIGDIDNDGKPDILVPSGSTNELLVHLNGGNDASGTPKFGAPVHFTTGLAPYSVAVADLNGDRLPDVVSANFRTQDLSVFYQTSQGSLDHTFVPIPTGNAPLDLMAGDFTGDGIPELACAMSNDNSAWIYGRNTSSVAPLAPLSKYDLANVTTTTIASASVPHRLAMADTRGRGVQDLLAAMETVNLTSAQPNAKGTLVTATGGFEVVLGANPLPGSVATIVSGGYNPIGTAVAAGHLFSSSGPLDVVLAETDTNDVTTTGFSLYKLVNGVYQRQLSFGGPFPGGLGLSRIVVTDVDGDGHDDIVVALGGSTSMIVYYNGWDFNAPFPFTGPPTFIGYGNWINPSTKKPASPLFLSQPFGSPLGRVSDIAVADVNHDGRKDIVFSGYTTASAGIYFGTSGPITPASSPPVPGTTKATQQPTFSAVGLDAGNAPAQIAIGDLNGDGLLDIAIPWSNDNTLAVYYQNPKPTGFADTFFGPVQLTTADTPTGCAIFDVDGDGRNDVVVSCRGANALNVFFQR